MIKYAVGKDLHVITELALLLWPEHTHKELTEELGALLAMDDARFFLAYDNELAVGFAQCQLRHDYVEGAETSPVGYVEGIYVRDAYRGRGLARELVRACEAWARERGCRELASDCEWDNAVSQRFHLATGFREANRIVCFVKDIEPRA